MLTKDDQDNLIQFSVIGNTLFLHHVFTAILAHIGYEEIIKTRSLRNGHLFTCSCLNSDSAPDARPFSHWGFEVQMICYSPKVDILPLSARYTLCLLWQRDCVATLGFFYPRQPVYKTILPLLVLSSLLKIVTALLCFFNQTYLANRCSIFSFGPCRHLSHVSPWLGYIVWNWI